MRKNHAAYRRPSWLLLWALVEIRALVMNGSWCRTLLPGWPLVPLRLWLLGAASGLVGVSLLFEQEVWPHHPQAPGWHWATLALLLHAAGYETLRVLWRWPAAYTGPYLLRLVFRSVVLAVCTGLGLLLLVAFVLTCVGVARLIF
jgi:hypothetical protein